MARSFRWRCAGGSDTERCLAPQRTRRVTVGGFRVYPNGVEFQVTVHYRSGRIDTDADPLYYDPEINEIDDVVLYGLELGDGTRWTNIDERFTMRNDEDVASPIVARTQGGSDGRTHHMRHWIWPLVPAGPVTFVAKWSAHGLDERSTTIDGDTLRSLSDKAQVLWTS